MSPSPLVAFCALSLLGLTSACSEPDGAVAAEQEESEVAAQDGPEPEQVAVEPAWELPAGIPTTRIEPPTRDAYDEHYDRLTRNRPAPLPSAAEIERMGDAIAERAQEAYDVAEANAGRCPPTEWTGRSREAVHSELGDPTSVEVEAISSRETWFYETGPVAAVTFYNGAMAEPCQN